MRFQKKHGHTSGGKRSPTYDSWMAMRGRCNNPTDKSYALYGGRGITVCARWQLSFDAFLSDMGERPMGMTVDRINSDGNYEPGNCRWATPAEQNRGRRGAKLITYRGETLCQSEWARRFGIDRETLKLRLAKGWTIERALNERTPWQVVWRARGADNRQTTTTRNE